mgnify:FL=1
MEAMRNPVVATLRGPTGTIRDGTLTAGTVAGWMLQAVTNDRWTLTAEPSIRLTEGRRYNLELRIGAMVVRCPGVIYEGGSAWRGDRPPKFDEVRHG